MNPVYYATYAAYEVGVRLVRLVPLPTAQRIFGAGGRRLFDRGGRRVGHALTNLRIAFPDLSEEERREIGRQSYQHLAWNLIDVARSGAWTEEDLQRHVELTDVEHLEEALTRRRGVLALGLHMGNFELALRVASSLGIPASVVMRPRANPLLERRIAELRTRAGAEMIAHRRAAPLILRALKRGRVVAVINDQYTKRSRGVMVPLFGARCSTSPGIATLALRSGAPVVPFYVIRDAPDHHRVVFLPALERPESGDRKRDIATATASHNAVIESIIRKHPEQWLWAHRRFRHSPDLPPDPYA